MTLEQITKYVIIAAGIAGVLFLFPFLLRLFAPFIAAFFIAAICQGMVRFLEQKAKISRGISSALLVTAIVALVSGAVFAMVIQLLSQAKNLIIALPDAIENFRIRLAVFTEEFDDMLLNMPPELSRFLDFSADRFQQYASDLSSIAATSALNAAKGFFTALPDILLFLTMFLLGIFFFTKDYRLIINLFRELFPEKFLRIATSAKTTVVRAFSSYIKAQLILMLLTSFLITVCLWIIGKDYALLWGIICGLVDFLPILGTAIILVPWALISLIYGDIYSFTALMIIQALVFVFRQLAEPKIISRQIGIHPILTLVSVYIGLKFFGITGVIFAPVLTLLGVNIFVAYKEKEDS